MSKARTPVAPTFVIVVALASSWFGSCGPVEDCPDLSAVNFQSGAYTEEGRRGTFELEFTTNYDAFTITHSDGTVETFTRVGPLRRYP